MEEQRYVISYLLKKDKKPKEIVRELKLVYKDDSLSQNRVYYWVNEIRRGRTDLSNNPSPGRPMDHEIDNAILSILHQDPYASARMIAKKLRISPSTVTSHLTNNLRMKNVFLRWVPHHLTTQQKLKRVEMAKSMLKFLQKAEKQNFNFIISGDESWFVYDYDHQRKWVIDNEIPDERVIRTNIVKKTMITLFIGIKGIVLFDIKPKKQKINGEYFISNIIQKIEKSPIAAKAIRQKKKLTLHYDNAPSHKSKIVTEYLKHSKLAVLDHPPYSPDISPCDFGIFGSVKNSLAGMSFNSEDELITAVLNYFESRDESFWKSIFQGWIRRLENCITNNGDYVQ